MLEQDSAVLGRLDRFGRLCENTFLCLLLGAMIAIGAMQIVQRNFLSTSFPWSDELLRLLVLWLGLAGAVAASRDDKQITIDILSRFLSEQNNLRLRVALNLFTAVVCAVLAWYGSRFVQMEREFASVVLTGLPAWIFQSIIPAAFALICYRYSIFFARDIRRLVIKREAA